MQSCRCANEQQLACRRSLEQQHALTSTANCGDDIAHPVSCCLAKCILQRRLESLFPRLQVLEKKQRVCWGKEQYYMEPLSAREQRKLQDEIARQEKQERAAGQQKLVRDGQLQKQQKVFAAADHCKGTERVHVMLSLMIFVICRDSRRCCSTNKHMATGCHSWNLRLRSIPL